MNTPPKILNTGVCSFFCPEDKSLTLYRFYAGTDVIVTIICTLYKLGCMHREIDMFPQNTELFLICFRKQRRIFDMFPQTVRQRDYIFHCLGACGDRGSAKKNKLKEDRKSPCLGHFCGIRLSEKRGWCRFFCPGKWGYCSGETVVLLFFFGGGSRLLEGYFSEVETVGTQYERE